jgi:hypothetical protein
VNSSANSRNAMHRPKRTVSPQRRRFLPPLLTALALSLVISLAEAHDFWIEPSAFSPKPGQSIQAALRVGHAQEVEGYARNPRHLREFFLQAPDGKRQPLLGEPGADPAGFLKEVPAGLSWIAYHSNFSSSDLEPAKFESYLREEGLERIIARRAELGESQKSGRERYARCAKALVRTEGATGAFGAVLGLPVELVLEADPLIKPEAREGQAPQLPVRLLAAGQAQVEALIVLERIDGPLEQRASFPARSDAEGLAAFPWPTEGRWLLSAVHMERAEGAEDHEWRSHFASLTFELPPVAPAAPERLGQ